jgi:hypothetical protein
MVWDDVLQERDISRVVKLAGGRWARRQYRGGAAGGAASAAAEKTPGNSGSQRCGHQSVGMHH